MFDSVLCTIAGQRDDQINNKNICVHISGNILSRFLSAGKKSDRNDIIIAVVWTSLFLTLTIIKTL